MARSRGLAWLLSLVTLWLLSAHRFGKVTKSQERAEAAIIENTNMHGASVNRVRKPYLLGSFEVVPATGLEPVQCYLLEPESSASANSATRA